MSAEEPSEEHAAKSKPLPKTNPSEPDLPDPMLEETYGDEEDDSGLFAEEEP